MGERRSLSEGILSSRLDPVVAKELLDGGKLEAAAAGLPPQPPAPVSQAPAAPIAGPLNRVPFSTRMRADLAASLKRASLERQLGGLHPHTVTDIFEAAIEPWLKANGYLP